MREETYLAILRAIQPTEATDPANVAHCNTCGFDWDDSLSTELTPAPAARCPNEYNHDDEDDYGSDEDLIDYVIDGTPRFTRGPEPAAATDR